MPGPRAEKDATTGAGLKSSASSVGRITAVGFLNRQEINGGESENSGPSRCENDLVTAAGLTLWS